MNNYNRLSEICWKQMDVLGLTGQEERLKEELREIKKKQDDEAGYFLDLYDRKIKVDKNEHNLLICYLLGICPSFDAEKGPAYTEADAPDIDTDYHPAIREYLKDDFSFRQYGKEHVCNITTYQTYAVKSSLIDMARTLCKDRDEILFITTRLGLKDDEGDDISFNMLEETFEKVEEKISTQKKLTKFETIAKDLSDYRQDYPEVWESAKELVAASYLDWKKFGYDKSKPPRRKKSMGLHASAVIISNIDLQEFIPLVVPPGSRELGLQASAWVEGLSDTDCSSVGLIKFDYLSLEANAKVAECNRLIMERHGLKSICALPGLANWSDTSYLNDPKVLEMANAGDLKGIFQFDSPGIRKLVKKGGVTSFDDLVAYASLFRPGPMDADMHDEYCDRKNGIKDYDRHPLLDPILGNTYGIMCIHEDTLIAMADGREVPIKQVKGGDFVDSVNIETKKIESKECHGCGPTRFCEGVKVTLENGMSVTLTDDHEVFTYEGRKEAGKLKLGDLVMVPYNGDKSVCFNQCGDVCYYQVVSVDPVGKSQFYGMSVADNHNLVANGIVVKNCYQEQVMKILNVIGDIPLKDCEAVRKAISKKREEKFLKYKDMFIANGAKKLGKEYVEKLWDLVVAFSGYGFNLSHAVAYTYISVRELWQKAHYPIEFYTAALKSLKTGDNRIIDYIHDARKRNIPINPININKSKVNFEIVDEQIYYGFSKVKGVGKSASKIVELQPYRDFQDFLDRFGTEAKVVQPLIGLRAFEDKDPLTLYLYYEMYKKATKHEADRRNRHRKSIDRYMEELARLAGKDWAHGFDDSYFGKLRSMLNDEQWIELCRLKKKYDKCVDTFTKKVAEDIGVSLPSFDIGEVKLNKAAFKTYQKMKPLVKDTEGIKAQIEFYGFPWMNEFERCPNYRGFTFEEYEIDIMRAESGTALPVEVKIESVEHTTSKSGKMQYWKLRVTDALEPSPKTVTVWEHDYDKFESILQPGNLVRLRLLPPEPPYPNYSLEGPKPWEIRHKKKNSCEDGMDMDVRVVLLRRADRKKKYEIEELDDFEKAFESGDEDE